MHGLLGMEHGCNSAEYHLNPPFPISIGDFPPSFDLNSQHHGYSDKINRIIKIYGFKIFIDKFDVNVIRQSRCEDGRTVGGKMKLGQTFKFGPFGIDQFEFHRHILYFGRAGNQSTSLEIRIKNFTPPLVLLP